MRRLFVVMTLCCINHSAARQAVESASQIDGSSHFQSKLNVVVVPVTLRDARGHEVGNVKKEEFEIFDNNKLQRLTNFTVRKRSSEGPPSSGSDKALRSAIPASNNFNATPPDRFIAFLFDDLHLSSSDLTHAQEACLKILAQSLSDKVAAAVFSISGATNSGLTLDRTKLADAVRTVHLQAIYQQSGPRCPDLSYYQSELIVKRNDDQALRSAIQETIDCSGVRKEAAEQKVHAVASQISNAGTQSTLITIEMMKLIVQKMGTLPGQSTLVLISPGFLTKDTVHEKSELIDIAAKANVTISTLNTKGLYVNEPPLSVPLSSSPELLRAKSDSYRMSALAGEDVLAELAHGTGGEYFHNRNDLSSGLEGMALAPEYLYLLEFSPDDTTQDGSYHRLKVTVDQQGLKIQARLGYYAAKVNRTK